MKKKYNNRHYQKWVLQKIISLFIFSMIHVFPLFGSSGNSNTLYTFSGDDTEVKTKVYNLMNNSLTFNLQNQQVANSSKLTLKKVENTISFNQIKNNNPVNVFNVQVSVTGVVVDNTGEPIPGVSIAVLGASIGTVTDVEGRYVLSVPEGSTLVFSYIGFETQRVILGNQTVIDVTLNESTASLDEVVVVGYST
ncbi:MAG: carboxypeptidase-like regulatory domain-containing protein, partial [Bacteroidota bacterium]|nr:carboxypeptidase-like regulatory domain-containing protein [Bacteroidota bacterium]